MSSTTSYKGSVSDWCLIMDICLWILWNGDSSETSVLEGGLKISEIRFSKILYVLIPILRSDFVNVLYNASLEFDRSSQSFCGLFFSNLNLSSIKMRACPVLENCKWTWSVCHTHLAFFAVLYFYLSLRLPHLQLLFYYAIKEILCCDFGLLSDALKYWVR